MWDTQYFRADVMAAQHCCCFVGCNKGKLILLPAFWLLTPPTLFLTLYEIICLARVGASGSEGGSRDSVTKGTTGQFVERSTGVSCFPNAKAFILTEWLIYIFTKVIFSGMLHFIIR